MTKTVARVFSREFKLAAVRRMLAGEKISALSRELNVLRKDLYVWRDRFREGGAEALRSRGRPRKSEQVKPPDPPREEGRAVRRRIAELERKVGQQQLELDFFRQALRQVGAKRRPSDGPGAIASSRLSRR